MVILSTPDELDEFNEAFKGSVCQWSVSITSIIEYGKPFRIGMDGKINALDVFDNYFRNNLVSVTPTEKALRYLYKLVGEDYDNHR